MLKNYLKIAWRNLFRNGLFTSITISGLAIGMTLAILLLLLVRYEFTYDQFHDKKDQLYQVFLNGKYDNEIKTSPVTPQPLAPILKANYPEIANAARLTNWELLINSGEYQSTQSIAVVEPEFFKMFNFPLLNDESATEALATPHSIILSEELAAKLFAKNVDPIGKTLNLEGQIDVTVTGILKNTTHNSSININAALPWALLKLLGYESDFWGNNSALTFLELNPDTNPDAFNQKISKTIKENADLESEIFIHPMEKWHLYARFENGVEAGGRITIVRMYMTVAGLIILIACINFMNLSTARSHKRSKEIGIRKISGAGRKSLMKQFLTEALLIAAISACLSLLLAELLIPYFSNFISKPINIPHQEPLFWLAFAGFILFSGLLAGSYPSFYLSSFKASKVLKGTFIPGKASLKPRQVFVIIQFTFAITLIAATIIVKEQYEHAYARELGFDKEQLVFTANYELIKENYPALREELLQSEAIQSVSANLSPITDGYSSSDDIEWPGKMANENIIFDSYSSDANLVETAGLDLMVGRDIDVYKHPSDSSGMLINETALKAMGLQNPLGTKIKFNNREWEILGVVKDFVLRSPFEEAAPMIICGPHLFFNAVHFKLNPENSIADNMTFLDQKIRAFNGNVQMDFKFADEELAAKYNGVKRTSQITTIFCGVAIFISCIGLFGLASFITEQRSKEISIRKVLGSSVSALAALISYDFIKMVMIAIIFALPNAYFAMQWFLKSFSYRINLEWYYFIITAIVALFIAILTVSGQAIKAAMLNPVDSLKSE